MKYDKGYSDLYYIQMLGIENVEACRYLLNESDHRKKLKRNFEVVTYFIDNTDKSLNDVGKRFGISGNRVSQILARYCRDFRTMQRKALEKQIPKKLLENGTCPCCKYSQVATLKVCWHCGQAIDWSDE